ncbi:hypothetical protein GCM10027073_40950 [Streptomyces chlorus]|uniref:Group II intron maturase-specific domain-containing protein n=1 Tax=Streptomyces chlorus TaxID=887452 RepID=A0ABW1DWF7_9ACTN
MQYFGRFYRSALTPLLTRINAYLVRWIRQKHKKLAALRKALQKMWEIADRYPRMFAHWRWTTVASVAWCSEWQEPCNGRLLRTASMRAEG